MRYGPSFLNGSTDRPSLRKRWAWTLIFAAACLSGCANPRVVLVPHGQPVKIGPDVTGRVYVLTDQGWELSANAVHLPEGWYALPDDEQ